MNGCYIDHAPEPIAEGVLIQLTQRLRDGDRTVASKIIRGHIRLAYSIATRFAYSNPRKTDDLICEAYTALVQAVRWASNGHLTHDNITSYISATIQRYLREYLEYDHIIRIPRSQYRIHGDNAPKFRMISFYNREGDLVINPQDKHNEIDDLDDFLEYVCATSTETQICKLRVDDPDITLECIAKSIGCSKQWVSEVLKNLFQKYLRVKGIA